MKRIDANVLIYAAHSEAQNHARCLAWMNSFLATGEEFAQTELIAAAFLRITTNPKAWQDPFTIDEALFEYDSVRSRGQCRWFSPGAKHWSIFSTVCKVSLMHANLVNDAWLAALALENDCEMVSTDTDFSRFPGLRWVNPLATAQ